MEDIAINHYNIVVNRYGKTLAEKLILLALKSDILFNNAYGDNDIFVVVNYIKTLKNK